MKVKIIKLSAVKQYNEFGRNNKDKLLHGVCIDIYDESTKSNS
jgi:hypothetical protein